MCPWCWYARDRVDICGVYCTGGFTNQDGRCDHFLDYNEEKKRRAAKRRLRANVVKTCWKVITKDRVTGHKRVTLLWAESREAARVRAPEGEDVISVEAMDGRGTGE